MEGARRPEQQSAPPMSGASAATGTLGATPLAHLLVYAHQRALSGVLRVSHNDEWVELELARGMVRDVRTSSPVAYLGQILYELGIVDGASLNQSLAALAASRRQGQAVRHGELLLQQGVIGKKDLASALAHQMERKAVHAFSLPDEATFVFRPAGEASKSDDLEDRDPYGLVWAGLRAYGNIDRAKSVLARLGDGPLHLDPHFDLERFGFVADERPLAEHFRGAGKVGMGRPEVMVAYVLAITKALSPAPATTAWPSAMSRESRAPFPSISDAPPRSGAPGADRISGSSPRVSVAPKRFTTPPMGSVRVPKRTDSGGVASPISGRGPFESRDDFAPPSRPHSRPAAKLSNDPKANFHNAEIALAQHDLELAEMLCRRAHEEEPRHAEYLALLGWLRTFRPDGNSSKAVEESLEMLERALDLHPGCERAYLYRAHIRKASGDFEGALSDYRSIHALNPQNVEAAREIRIHGMRAARRAEQLKRSSGLFQRILGKK